MSGWIKRELRGGKHYPGGDEEQVENTLRDLNAEFKIIYGEFSQKVLNVPMAPARKIAESCDAPLALGLVAYQISQDGILQEETACKLLQREYTRLKRTDYAVPPIESSEIDFAVREGQWIEYLYKKFVRRIDDLTGPVTTIAGLLNSKEIPLEKILMILHERDKITRGVIAPILREWVVSHRKAPPFQGALVVLEAILRSPSESEKAKSTLVSKIGEVRGILDRLRLLLQQSDFSSWSIREMEPVKRKIRHLEDSLQQMNSPVESMSETGLAELIAQSIPIKIASPETLEKGSYLVITSPAPKYGELPPLLEDPYDFLERDIRLAGRREDSEEFMRKVAGKVHKVLAGDKNPPIEVAANMIMQMHDRFSANSKPSREELLAKLGAFVRKEEKDLKVVERTDLDSLYDFLSRYFLDTFVNHLTNENVKSPVE